MPSTSHKLEMAHSAANDALRGVAMQHYRISTDLPEDERFFAGAGFRREVDLQLLLVLVIRSRRAVELGAHLLGDTTLNQELRDFDQRFPAAKQMRDIGEHVDAYIDGKGHKQKDVLAGSLGLRTWEDSPDGNLTFSWAYTTVSISELNEAAHRLYKALRTAIDPTDSG